MKSIAAVACLLFFTSLMQAQSEPAKPVQSQSPTAKAAKEKAAAKKEEPLPKIPGTTFKRPNGTVLGLTLEEGKFKVTFYTAKHKPMKVDVTRALARWPNVHGPGDHRTVLNPAGDGTYLLGAQFVRGPHAFRLTITLIQGEGDTAEGVETYVTFFNG